MPSLTTSRPSPCAILPEVDKQYAYWRFRLMYALIIGYSAFYMARQSIALAVPGLQESFGYSKTQIGWMFTGFSVIYGISKFIIGSICDRSNSRYFMTIGLLGVACMSLGMGLSSSLWIIGTLYAFSGWFQSMGWAACIRMLTRWYGPRQLATRWATCSVSHQIGSISTLLAMPIVIAYTGSWRWACFTPGIICICLCAFLLERLRDTPTSLGLPPVEVKEGLVSAEAARADAEEPATYREIFVHHILSNRPLWCLCTANFFMYVIRMGFFNWAPTFLKEMKHISLLQSGFKTACFELAGIFGGILAGWLSDKVFNGYRGRVSFIYMVLLTFAMLTFWYMPHVSGTTEVILLLIMGFLIYGPQVLLGVASAEFGSKKAACAAAGLNGTFGYLGGAASGVGVGYIAEHYGWGATFSVFIVAALIGSICVLATWNQGRCITTGALKTR